MVRCLNRKLVRFRLRLVNLAVVSWFRFVFRCRLKSCFLVCRKLLGRKLLGLIRLSVNSRVKMRRRRLKVFTCCLIYGRKLAINRLSCRRLILIPWLLSVAKKLRWRRSRLVRGLSIISVTCIRLLVVSVSVLFRFGWRRRNLRRRRWMNWFWCRMRWLRFRRRIRLRIRSRNLILFMRLLFIIRWRRVMRLIMRRRRILVGWRKRVLKRILIFVFRIFIFRFRRWLYWLLIWIWISWKLRLLVNRLICRIFCLVVFLISVVCMLLSAVVVKNWFRARLITGRRCATMLRIRMIELLRPVGCSPV